MPRLVQRANSQAYSIIYALVGIVCLLFGILIWMLCRSRIVTRRTRQRLNDARQYELENFAPPQTETSVRSDAARAPPSGQRDLSGYADHPLPPVPIQTRSRPRDYSQPSAARSRSNLAGPQTRSQPHTSAATTESGRPVFQRQGHHSRSPQQPRPDPSRRMPSNVDDIVPIESTTDDSTNDPPPAGPVVNEAYARARTARDAAFAQMGYTASEAMLASDMDIPTDIAGPARTSSRAGHHATRPGPSPTPAGLFTSARGRPPYTSSDDRSTTPRRGRSQAPTPTPHSSTGLSAPRSRSQATHAHPHPPALLQPHVYQPNPSRASPASTSSSIRTIRARPSHYQPPRVDDTLPEADSTGFSQLDLGTSTGDGDALGDEEEGLYNESTAISDDFWEEEVRANQRRRRGGGGG